MKTAIRIIITLFAFLATYYFISFIPFSLIQLSSSFSFIPIVVSLLIAVPIGYLVWKKLRGISNSLATYIFMGGVITGSIAFILGFVGPIIISPSSNQGPLLGIFITGPLGFLVGLIGGGIFWQIKVKNKKV